MRQASERMKAVLSGAITAISAMRTTKKSCKATPASTIHKSQRPNDFMARPATGHSRRARAL